MPLRGRADYTWPNDRRLAVYFALNLEHFPTARAWVRNWRRVDHSPTSQLPWRDYGNRVGAWYMLDAFDALQLPLAALVNSAMYDYAPDLVAACRARGDEIVGHGRTNAERQGDLDEAAERALIGEATAAPDGSRSPDTGRLARPVDFAQPRHARPAGRAGYRYLLDWSMDDQPVWFDAAAASASSPCPIRRK